MGVLQRFERRIEEMVNRPFARAFKAEVEPVEIASALQRECDNRAAIVARGRTIVPNAFTVILGTRDYERLSVYADALGAELAAMVHEHAQDQGYTFLGPVSVAFESDDELETGRFRVRSSAIAGATAAGLGRTGARPRTGEPWLEIGSTAYPLATPVTRIGRGSDNDLRIEDPGISRHHAEIHVAERDASIVDLGSTNGVIVNGRRMQQAGLSDGASIVLGSTTLTFHAQSR